MNIVLLGHSHVGKGVYEAINRVREAKLVLAAGYGKTETLVPAPNLIADWNKRGIKTACIMPGGEPSYFDWPAGDILISANWRHKIPQAYIEKFPLAINFHGCNTHLRKYRGRRPIQRQIEDGCKTFFLTSHRLVEKYDAGEILAQTFRNYPFTPSQLMVYCDMRLMAFEIASWLLPNWEALCQTSTS